MKSPPIALTIAGSDPCAGAGIQADLKTFSVLGIYGVCAITAITYQNTLGVQGVYPLPAEVVGQQLGSLLGDFKIRAVKTGMLWGSETIREITQKLSEFGLQKLGEGIPLVVDPILAAGDGTLLLEQEALSTLKSELLPIATLVTPNLAEAQTLCGFEVNNLDQMHLAAQTIHKLGSQAVLIKGGHLRGEEALDLLYDGSKFTVYTRPRRRVKRLHGTGCALSAAITAGLACGKGLPQAIAWAQEYINANLRRPLSLGHGAQLLAHRKK